MCCLRFEASGCSLAVRRFLPEARRSRLVDTRLRLDAALPEAQRRALLAQLLGDFAQVAGLTPAQLLGRLLRRGRWVKAAKLWRACRRCLALS